MIIFNCTMYNLGSVHLSFDIATEDGKNAIHKYLYGGIEWLNSRGGVSILLKNGAFFTSSSVDVFHTTQWYFRIDNLRLRSISQDISCRNSLALSISVAKKIDRNIAHTKSKKKNTKLKTKIGICILSNFAAGWIFVSTLQIMRQSIASAK